MSLVDYGANIHNSFSIYGKIILSEVYGSYAEIVSEILHFINNPIWTHTSILATPYNNIRTKTAIPGATPAGTHPAQWGRFKLWSAMLIFPVGKNGYGDKWQLIQIFNAFSAWSQKVFIIFTVL